MFKTTDKTREYTSEHTKKNCPNASWQTKAYQINMSVQTRKKQTQSHSAERENRSQTSEANESQSRREKPKLISSHSIGAHMILVCLLPISFQRVTLQWASSPSHHRAYEHLHPWILKYAIEWQKLWVDNYHMQRGTDWFIWQRWKTCFWSFLVAWLCTCSKTDKIIWESVFISSISAMGIFLTDLIEESRRKANWLISDIFRDICDPMITIWTKYRNKRCVYILELFNFHFSLEELNVKNCPIWQASFQNREFQIRNLSGGAPQDIRIHHVPKFHQNWPPQDRHIHTSNQRVITMIIMSSKDEW